MQLRRGRGGKTVTIRPSPSPSRPPVVGDSVKTAVTGGGRAAVVGGVVHRTRQATGRGDAAGRTAATATTGPKVNTRARATHHTRK